tara:strand:- start:214 stop:714 length:501 start_codon:yes stop_codon:yes gene_type:complete
MSQTSFFKLAYIPNEKKTGKPILIMGQTDQVKTSKGITKAWKNENFTNSVMGIGTILMSYDPKKPDKKSCVLSIENFQAVNFDENQTEKYRLWFCKGNFTQYNKGKLNINYAPNDPIVRSDHKGNNRQNIHIIKLKNAKFEISLNNAISKEKCSGATTILRVFSHD